MTMLIVTWSGGASAGAAELGVVIADRAMALAASAVNMMHPSDAS
ncbi:hypothetical protein [Amycolatopsis magusensis]